MTTSKRRMRTTAFRLNDNAFGRVYGYHCGEIFNAAWQNLERRWRSTRVNKYENLPYGSLEAALRVLLNDFVIVNSWIGTERYVFLSRQSIDKALLRRVIRAWETLVFGDAGPLTSAASDLTEHELMAASVIERRQGACPLIQAGWAWKSAIWDVAHRLASRKLETDARKVSLRLDSDASLLTWEDLVAGEMKNGNVYAMHRIIPKLITLPDVEDPVLSLQSSLVRLDPGWYGNGWAWADLKGAMLLRAYVRVRPYDGVNGVTSWAVEWADQAAELLEKLRADPLPRLDPLPSATGDARKGFRTQPKKKWALGSGVGPWFHEFVARHAYAVLDGIAEPIDMYAPKHAWPTRDKVAPRQPLPTSRRTPPRIRVLFV